MKEFAWEFESFVLSTIEKYHNVRSSTYDPSQAQIKKTILKRKQHLFLLKKGKLWYFFKDQGRGPKKVEKRAEKRFDRDFHTPDNMYCD